MTGRLAGRPVSAVLFDYGNTLITVERPERALHETYEHIAQRLGDAGYAAPGVDVLIRDVHDRVDSEFLAHQRTGALEEIDLASAAHRAYADLGIDLDPQTLDQLLRLEQEAWWVGLVVDPDAVPTLDALRAAGIGTGLCSNAPWRVESMHAQLAHVGLREHLDAVTFSGAVGWRKPAPQIFAAALDALGASAAETVMVGDTVREDVAGAQRAGLRAILYRPDGSPADGDGTADATVDRLPAVLEVLGLAGAKPEQSGLLRRSL